MLQSVAAGELATVHAGEPGARSTEARAVDETARRDGRPAEGQCDRRLEPAQLRHQRVQRARPADQGRHLQAPVPPPEGALLRRRRDRRRCDTIRDAVSACMR